MKTAIEQMYEQMGKLDLEISSIKRYQENAMLEDGQFDLITKQIEIMVSLKNIINDRIEYDKEFYKTIGLIK